MAFPPIPVYPDALDSDYTLYTVHNTTETKLREDNSAWSQEIDIIPVDPDKTDIWSDNGFANIEGELFYYDSVTKNSNSKVIKLKQCSRQLGGNTQFNPRGTWVRSYVVAEHHNQLVNGILKTQDFIGYNFDTRQKTLDWRIRNLQTLDIIFDDFDCPDVVFTFNITEDDAVTGKVATYILEITPPGSISNFRLDFGDGNFTTTTLSGTHRYAVNARIDPVVTVSNNKCEILQTPIERINPTEPSPQIEESFVIPIPEIPDFPDFTFVTCEVPEPDIKLPELIFPCISIEGQIGPLPSVITGPDINMVSNVTITSNNPVQILHSTVTIIGGINIPPIILIDPPVPPTIIIDPPIPPTIVIVPPQSQIVLELEANELPRLEVDWGSPPEMEVALTLAKNVKTPSRFAVDPEIVGEFGEEFADLFEASETMKVEYETVGIPEEIIIVPPDIPAIKIDADDIPRKIKIDSSEVKIPSDIQIHGPKSPIPNSIRLDGSEVPEAIDLVYKGKAIPVEFTGMPSMIEVKMEKTIPESIIVEMPQPIPDTILIEHNLPDKLILEGPASIPLELPENIVLPVKFPDEMPEIEMIYRGAPIEVKITMEEIISKDADGKQCVMIVPCSQD